MEEIIKKAIKGGYLDNGDRYVIKIDGVFIGYNNSIVLDSLFWQALGKACGWYKEDQVVWIIPSGMDNTEALIYIEDNLGIPIKEARSEIIYSPYKKGKEGWKFHALRFNEINLTEGWEKAVTYLTEVTN